MCCQFNCSQEKDKQKSKVSTCTVACTTILYITCKIFLQNLNLSPEQLNIWPCVLGCLNEWTATREQKTHLEYIKSRKSRYFYLLWSHLITEEKYSLFAFWPLSYLWLWVSYCDSCIFAPGLLFSVYFLNLL